MCSSTFLLSEDIIEIIEFIEDTRHKSFFDIYGIALDYTDLYLIAELHNYVSLTTYLRKNVVTPTNKYKILRNIATSYCYLHTRDVTIRHISQDDVYVDENFRIKIDHCRKYFYGKC